MFHYYKDLDWMKISNEVAYNKRATISSIDMKEFVEDVVLKILN